MSSSSTFSSFSSVSSDSSLSTWSSLSSVSSESSEWDQEWYSILYRPNPTRDTCLNVYEARIQLDLRHSDAIIVEHEGPFILDIGAELEDGSESLIIPSCHVELIDNKIVTQTFESHILAEMWQDAMELKIRTILNSMRSDYYSVYPGTFEARHRRV